MKALSLRPAMTSRIRTVAVSPLSVPYRRSTPPCFSVDITYMQKEHSVRRFVHSRHCPSVAAERAAQPASLPLRDTVDNACTRTMFSRN